MTTPAAKKSSGSAEDATKTGASKIAQAQVDEVESVRQTEPGSGRFGADTTVVKVDDGVDAVAYDESDGATMVTIKGEMVEEFYFPDTTRPSYRTLYHAGQVVPKSVVDEYNAAVARRKQLAENDGVDPANPAGVDSTTLASGTFPGVEAVQQ